MLEKSGYNESRINGNPAITEAHVGPEAHITRENNVFDICSGASNG